MAKDYSNDKIEQLRAQLTAASFEFPGATVVVVGSLARREASDESDIDYFIINDGAVDSESVHNSIKSAISSSGLRPPSAGGAFAKAISRSDFLASIGGSTETNDDLTRRMLFLLESEWIMGGNVYKEIFSSIVDAYISDNITQHQLAKFFLNDLIRYYRTICVDFEYKTTDGNKSWGDRNLKLLFARKLMYFSGVIVAAQTAQSTARFKRAELIRLLSMTPVDRLQEICGTESGKAINLYDRFLLWMSKPEKRALLRETAQARDGQKEEFREMKNVAHHFSWELHLLLLKTFPPGHPIHLALIL